MELQSVDIDYYEILHFQKLNANRYRMLAILSWVLKKLHLENM